MTLAVGPNYAVPHPDNATYYGFGFDDAWYEHGIAKYYNKASAQWQSHYTGVFGIWRVKVLK